MVSEFLCLLSALLFTIFIQIRRDLKWEDVVSYKICSSWSESRSRSAGSPVHCATCGEQIAVQRELHVQVESVYQFASKTSRMVVLSFCLKTACFVVGHHKLLAQKRNSKGQHLIPPYKQKLLLPQVTNVFQ